jgi:transcriptional regulator with XRE-family HTH domain
MSFSDQFFRALGITPGDRRALNAFAERSGVPAARLRHYNSANALPSGDDLPRILAAAGVTELELMLSMGRLSHDALSALQANAKTIAQALEAPTQETRRRRPRLAEQHQSSPWRRTWAGCIKATAWK